MTLCNSCEYESNCNAALKLYRTITGTPCGNRRKRKTIRQSTLAEVPGVVPV